MQSVRLKNTGNVNGTLHQETSVYVDALHTYVQCYIPVYNAKHRPLALYTMTL